ncbi:helix-turn-helix domain-containing protein [Streptomyces sp. NPDC048845]|uniref:PucR family transcriptional regulator n=1 Tax=Streptomyces sp. NPDC048845 TaxID=3155390 RepID=UPI0034216908
MGRSERAAAADALRRASPGPVTEIVAAVRRALPAYQVLHESQLDEVRSIARWALTRLLRMWVDDTGLTAADTDRARAIGRARAADGRSVEAVVRAYRVGAATVDRLLAENSAHSAGRLGPEDVFVLNRVWLRELDALTDALTGGYADAARWLDADRDRACRAFLDDLLAGRRASAAETADRARTLGAVLPDPAALLVTRPARAGRDASAQASAVAAGLELADRLGGAGSAGGAGAAGGTGSAGGARAAGGAAAGSGARRTADSGTAPAGLLFTARADHAVLLLPPERLPGTGPALRELGLRGCLLTGRAPDELAAAYRLALGALETAPGRAYDSDGLLDGASAQVTGLLNGVPGATPAAARREVLGPLLEPAHHHLARTLDAYLRTGSATAAADALHLHPQTLRYRMRRVRELTGRDERDPWQRLLLEVARTVSG